MRPHRRITLKVMEAALTRAATSSSWPSSSARNLRRNKAAADGMKAAGLAYMAGWGFVDTRMCKLNHGGPRGRA